MRVYLSACGIGLGHVSRVRSIADYLKHKHPEVKLYFSTYGDGIEYIKSKGYKYAVAPAIKLIEHADGTIDSKRTAIHTLIKGVPAFIKQVIFEIRKIKQFKPDVIFADTRLSTVIAGWLLRKPTYTILNQLRILIPHVKPLTKRKKQIKYFGELIILHMIMVLWNRSKRIFVSDFPDELTISKDTLSIPKNLSKKVEFIGPIINIDIFEKLHKSVDKNTVFKKLKTHEYSYLIYAGLSGTKQEVLSLMKRLEEVFLKLQFNALFVISLGQPNENKFRRNKNIIILSWVDDRTELLRASDLYIGRPGQLSIAETYYTMKPAIWVPSPAHTEQITNARSSQLLGVSLLLYQHQLSPERLEKTIHYLLKSPKVKENLKKVHDKVIQYHSLKRILGVVEQHTLDEK